VPISDTPGGGRNVTGGVKVPVIWLGPMGSTDVAVADAVAPADGDRPTMAVPNPEPNVTTAAVRTTALFGIRNAILSDSCDRIACKK